MTPWVAKNSRKPLSGVYHTDAECPRLHHGEKQTKVEQSFVENLELDLCRECDDDVDRTSQAGNREYINALKEAANNE